LFKIGVHDVASRLVNQLDQRSQTLSGLFERRYGDFDPPFVARDGFNEQRVTAGDVVAQLERGDVDVARAVARAESTRARLVHGGRAVRPSARRAVIDGSTAWLRRPLKPQTRSSRAWSAPADGTYRGFRSLAAASDHLIKATSCECPRLFEAQ